MSTLSASPADAGASAAPQSAAERRRILVWDAPVRVFHWLAVASFFGAWLTAESERWQLVHVTLGYTLAGLIVFRLVWGLIGTRHARFASFVRGPAAVVRYGRALLRGEPEHFVGHNPAGALAIVGLLAIGAVLTASGWATFNDLGGHAVEEVHEAMADLMMALVGVHVAGVVVSSWLHRENLVGAMVGGHKFGPPAEGIRHAWRSVAVLMLAAVLGFWAWQSSTAPVASPDGLAAVTAPGAHGHDDDDDGDD